MNRIHPKKLLHSKWTAVTPINREKHFVVTEVDFDDDQTVIHCRIEAVMSKRSQDIDWRDLKNTQHWLPGWR